jgi:N-acetylmuramoyl-L-alanine amidase
MKQLFVLTLAVLALILLTSCQHRQTTAKQQPPSPPPIAPQPPAQNAFITSALRDSTVLVRELTQNPEYALPDALLNRTRCFIVSNNQSQGLATCRTEAAPYAWSAPKVVTFSGIAAGGNLLLFVMSQRAATALDRSAFDVSYFSISAGKTQKQAALLTDRDLGYDAIAYRYARPTLTGFTLKTGEFKTDPVAVGASSKLSTEYLKWVQSYFNAITPTGIIIHHSAAIPTNEKVPKDVSTVDEYHAERGFDIECFGREYHVAYHYLIFPNGKVRAGRPERCEGAHARGYNSYIGISLVGDFSPNDNPSGKKGPGQPTRQQLASLVRLTRKLQEQYKIPVQRILRHSDVASTDCPGERFAFKTFLLTLEQPETSSR